MFGGLIFGSLWNGNLTTRTKGISYIFFTVLSGFTCFTLALSISAALLLGPPSHSNDPLSIPPSKPVPLSTTKPLERTEVADIYTDEETGASFVIPSTWSDKRFFVSRQDRKVKFRVPGDGGTAFYTSVRLNPDDPRRGMDDWADEDFSRLAGPNSSDVTVQRITLNDVEYVEMSAREGNADNVNLFHIRNGRVYGFQYVEIGSDIDDESLRTFYSMAASAVYP